MKKEKIIPAVMFMLGIMWIVKGVGEYGFLTKGAPGVGFFPVIVSVLLVFVSGLLIIAPAASAPAQIAAALSLRAFLPAVAVLVLAILVKPLGMVLSTGIMVFLWLIFAEKKHPVKAAAVGALMTVFVYLVFSVWLTVPFPKGLLGF